MQDLIEAALQTVPAKEKLEQAWEKDGKFHNNKTGTSTGKCRKQVQERSSFVLHNFFCNHSFENTIGITRPLSPLFYFTLFLFSCLKNSYCCFSIQNTQLISMSS
jgi:hypothetical protein